MSTYWERLLESRTLSRRRALGMASSGLTGAVLLAACGGDSSTDDGEQSLTSKEGEFTPSDGPPQRGGRFVNWYPTVGAWNPISHGPEGRSVGGTVIWDRLLTSREGERRYSLEAAESIETPDPLTVVFKLKPNQFFHDISPVNGRPVKASDIVASQEYVASLANAFDKTFVNDFLAKAEAPDDQTVILKLKRQAAYLTSTQLLGSANGQAIIPPEIYGTLDSGNQVASGPYYLVASESQLSVRHLYKRHPKFREAHKGLPYVDEVEFKFIPDDTAGEAAFRSGQVDRWTAPTPTQESTLLKDLGDRVHFTTYKGLANFSWNMNMDKEQFGFRDARVREAFWRLTNQQQISDFTFQETAEVPPGLLPAGLTLWDIKRQDVQQYYKEDVEKAKQLLSAANFNFQDIKCAASRVGSPEDTAAQVWQQQLARAGVKIVITNVAGQGQATQLWAVGDWEMMVQGSPGGDTPGISLRNLHTKGWSDVYRRFGLYDPEIDRLIEKSESELNVEENIRLVKEVQDKAIQRFSPFYQIATRRASELLRSRVQNWELSQVTPLLRHEMWVKQA